MPFTLPRQTPLRHRGAVVICLFSLFSFSALAQVPTCSAVSSATLVHQEGLAERVGDITLSCSGGSPGAAVSTTLFVSLNTNITNRLDANGIPQGIGVTSNSGSGASATGTVTLSSSSTLNISALNYSVPTLAATPVIIVISGIRASAASLSNGSAPAVVSASLQGVGVQIATQSVVLAITSPSLLQSTLNNGVPCNGSPLPPVPDFSGFSRVTNSSTVRVTEASAASFVPKQPGGDSGVRILLSLSGYGIGARVFVPDAVVGSDGTAPTSAGAFGVSSAAGIYTPGTGQLLLIRVAGANSDGSGGALSQPQPLSTTTFASVSEITVTNGTAYAVYEVVDSNNAAIESAQVPAFVAVQQTSCPSSLIPSVTAKLAPVSTVSIATATDPIPRFISTPPASDCKALNDCDAAYLPALTADTTPIQLTGSSLGDKQSKYIRVGNSGAGLLYFSTSVAYQSGSNWISLSPATGVNNASIQVIADPSGLQPGTYNATITVTAGAYGTATIPVTFVVGAAGVTISNVGNAASFQYGTVAPGSYAVLYGANLLGKNVGVTFNGLPATIVYDSAGQINLIVPAALGGQQAAAVIATVDNSVGNTFRVNLAPNVPGIFAPGIINFDDGSVNSADHPVTRGSFISIYLTGLTAPVTGPVTVSIGDRVNLTPSYAGAQPTLPALDQVNVTVPASLPATPNSVPLQVCVPGSDKPICSNTVSLYIR